MCLSGLYLIFRCMSLTFVLPRNYIPVSCPHLVLIQRDKKLSFTCQTDLNAMLICIHFMSLQGRTQFPASQWVNLPPYTVKMSSHLCKVAVYCGSSSITCCPCGLLYRSLPHHVVVVGFSILKSALNDIPENSSFHFIF